MARTAGLGTEGGERGGLEEMREVAGEAQMAERRRTMLPRVAYSCDMAGTKCPKARRSAPAVAIRGEDVRAREEVKVWWLPAARSLSVSAGTTPPASSTRAVEEAGVFPGWSHWSAEAASAAVLALSSLSLQF